MAYQENMGALLPVWSVTPFLGMLLSIALFPLLAPRLWHRSFPIVSFFWAFITAVYLINNFKSVGINEILHIILADYIPFFILISSLYTIAGGLYITINTNRMGSPLVNTVLLATGTLSASILGTTGASMIFIKPLIRVNRSREIRPYLIVFFIFLVSNIGGSLTPLGDPPLFLGFLKGVPFFWTLNLFFPFAVASGILLILFFLLDSYFYRIDKRNLHNPIDIYADDVIEDKTDKIIKIEGKLNLALILGVLIAVVISGKIQLGYITILGIDRALQDVIRDIFILSLAIISVVKTPKEIRIKNEFSWFPVKEVGILFFGIFISMIPAIKILQAGEHGALGFLIKSIETPAHYFWASGTLSSFLDNAPTYLVFLNSALGKFYPGMETAEALRILIKEHPTYLLAVSCGCVFFGAVSYIGNAPNLMSASIAAELGVKMPSFFGYILKYSIPLLIPTFTIITLLFFLQ